MKKFLSGFLKIIGLILGLLIAVILFFTIQANLRESKTRHEAAPSTGRFVQAGDVELYIQEMGPANGQPILFIHGDRDEFGAEPNIRALYERVAANTEAELIVFPNCGHFFDDDLNQLRDTIRNWVEKEIERTGSSKL